MSDIYVYKNRFWKPTHIFGYTGAPEKFTLTPGEYLFMCNGAKGGRTNAENVTNYGGTSYGILNLNEQSDFYAVVGGDGQDITNTREPSIGGYNGGGNGGGGHSSYIAGAGGGGASDVRLNIDPDIPGIIRYTAPDEYDEVEYIESDGTQYIDTGYIHKVNTKIECVCEVSSSISIRWGCLFGARWWNTYYSMALFTRFDDSNKPTFYCASGRYDAITDGGFPYNNKTKVEVYNNVAAWYDTDGNYIGKIVGGTQNDGRYSTYIFEFNNGGSPDGSKNIMKLYSFKIYEDDTLLHWYVPVKTNDPNQPTVAGLYDLVGRTFLQKRVGNDFTTGDIVETKTAYEKETIIPVSLLSRIMVAGGGGGSPIMGVASGEYACYFGIGGGASGGQLICNASDENANKIATQEEGYSFGIGMTPPNKTSYANWGAEGAAGGGGGWYGGYSSNSQSMECTSCGGGGGSGYVLTESSYKPERYTDYVSEDYYFTDTLMTGGTAESSSIIICQEISRYNAGDTLIFPCVGWTEKVQMYLGKYRIKCWGGDGGARYTPANIARGGYAEAIMSPQIPFEAYVTVGGSGLRSSTAYESTLAIRPTLAFNGGGTAGALNDVRSSFGGGASDVRINSNNLLARVIVAGGAGGHGSAESSGDRFGGAGGGTTGGVSSNTSNGTVPGPGTQTESPAHDTVGGDFGLGGNGSAINGGFGGAGGGGWYGGSGCLPNGSSDNDRGGCGGSGYILTESSNKPVGYLVGKDFYMTDGILTTGGNNLSYGQTKIEIDVIDVSFAKMLCKDDEGFKYFNKETGAWEFLFVRQPTIEEFEEYGSFSVTTDDGLLNNYEIYVYDEVNSGVDTATFTVRPPKQTIRTVAHTPNFITKLTIDADIDSDNVDFEVQSTRHGIAEDARVELTISANMHDEPNMETKVYCVHAYTQGKATTYVDPKKKEKTIDHIDLLPVGIGNKMPSRYKSYLGGFINNSEAITAVNSGVSCERNRNIYSATLCNDTVVRFTKLNLVTNTSTIIKDIPKTQLGNTYYGGLLVDDEYMYLTSSYNNNTRIIYRISLDPNNTTVDQYSPGSDSNYSFNCFGKMEWWNDHTIIICYRYGFLLFDTKTLTWTVKNKSDSISPRYDFAVGKKYAMAMYGGNSQSAWVCDIETNTWYGFKETWGSWIGKYQNCCCYANGKFYVTQQNYLYIVDEDEMAQCLETGETLNIHSIVTPYSSLTPKTINYADGVLYITILNSQTLYIYDIANDRFTSTALPFAMNGWDQNGWCRPTSFRGYFFAANIRLYVINFVEYAKYNMGYKYDQFSFLTNSDHESEYEYDERFVSFTDSYMTIHDGDIQLPLEVIDETNHILKVDMDKSQYNEFISFKLTKEREEDPTDESTTDSP